MAQRMIFFPQRRRVNGKLIAFTLLFLAVGLICFAIGLRVGVQKEGQLSTLIPSSFETVLADF